MLYDGIKLAEGSDAKNLVVETGTSFPTGPNRTPDAGELFYRTDAGNVGLWVFDGFIWQKLGTGTGELPDIVPAGTYRSVTVSTKGLVTAGTNPTTLAGYGITDAAPLGHVGAAGGAHAAATVSVAGFMSAADKSKLDGINIGTFGNSVPALNGANTWSGLQTFIAAPIRIDGNGTGQYSVFQTYHVGGASNPSWAVSMETDRDYLLEARDTLGASAVRIRVDHAAAAAGSILAVGPTALTYGGNNVYHAGNLSFGSGLTFSGGVLSSSGGAAFNGGTITGALTITSASPQLTLGNATNSTGRILGPVTSAGGGGGLQINAGSATTAGQAGGDLDLMSGHGLGPGPSGTITIRPGNSAASTSARLHLRGSVNTSNGIGGNIEVDTGSSTSGTGGDFILRSGASGHTVIERLRILANGAWSVGSAGTNTGTSGQVLTSNGSGSAPTWITPSGPGLTAHQTWTGQNTYSSSSLLLYDGATMMFGRTGASIGNPHIIVGQGANNVGFITGSNNSSGGVTGSLTVAGGGVSANNVTAGTLFLSGGQNLSSSPGNGGGGNATLAGGDTSQPSGAGGSVTVRGGIGAGGNGHVALMTANVERLRILANGAWSVGTGGTATGTSGQVLTSAGAGAPPTWQTFQDRRVIPVRTSNAATNFAQTDAGGSVIKTDDSTYAWTIPTDAAASWAGNVSILVCNDGIGGNCTITPASGVTLTAGLAGGNFNLLPGESRLLHRTATNTWRIR